MPDLWFRSAAALGVAVTVITEVLSLLHRLTPAWLAVSWALAAARSGRGSSGRGM